MKLNTNMIGVSAIFAALIFTACNKTGIKSPESSTETPQLNLQEKMTENGSNPDEAIFAKPGTNNLSNHFYIESNLKSGNSVLVFAQKPGGQLILEDEVRSGGYGYGEALGTQGALAVSKNDNLLFAVNAGSNSISSFRINPVTGGLKLLFSVATSGQVPASLTIHGNKLYVLNNLTSTINGYTFNANGFLTPIAGSEHILSGMNVDAAQIKFSPDGLALYITEKKTNIIDKFNLDAGGMIISSQQITSHGIEPFGFDFARENKYMIVSNAANGFSGAGSATSYKFSATGLDNISGPISNYQSAPCWLATTQHGVYAYVANTATNNISSYYIDPNGALTLIKTIAAEHDGKAPIDIAISADNKFAYQLYAGSYSVVSYKRMPAGVIEYSDKITALPKTATGLAVY